MLEPLLPFGLNGLAVDELLFLCIALATAAPTPADAITSRRAAMAAPIRLPADIGSCGGGGAGGADHPPGGAVGGVADGGRGGLVGQALVDAGGHDAGAAGGWGCWAVGATAGVGAVGDSVAARWAVGAGGAGGQDSLAAFQV